MAITKNVLIGNAGEFFVCAELVSRGVVAAPAPKNNPEIDVIVTTQDGSRFANIQVKTMGQDNPQGWLLNKGVGNKLGSNRFFVVLVRLRPPGHSPDYYLFGRNEFSDLVNEDYAKYMSTPKRKGGERKATNFRWLDLKDYPDLLKERKDKWDLLDLW